jgi:hypothetical protein
MMGEGLPTDSRRPEPIPGCGLETLPNKAWPVSDGAGLKPTPVGPSPSPAAVWRPCRTKPGPFPMAQVSNRLRSARAHSRLRSGDLAEQNLARFQWAKVPRTTCEWSPTEPTPGGYPTTKAPSHQENKLFVPSCLGGQSSCRAPPARAWSQLASVRDLRRTQHQVVRDPRRTEVTPPGKGQCGCAGVGAESPIRPARRGRR